MSVSISIDKPDVTVSVADYDGYVEGGGVSAPTVMRTGTVTKIQRAGQAASAQAVMRTGTVDKPQVSGSSASAPTVMQTGSAPKGPSRNGSPASAGAVMHVGSTEGPWPVPWMPQDRTLDSLTGGSLKYTIDPKVYLFPDEPHDVPKRIKDNWSRGTEATYWDGTQLQTAAAHEPRIQVDPETGQKYLLAEPQRTNLLLNSDGLSGQTVTVSDATTYTLSFWGSGDVTLSNAHSKTVSGSGSSKRTTYTFTTAGTSLDVAVSGTVENAQLEEGNFATSYISNGSSQTTRAADDLSNLPIHMASGAKSVYFRIEQEANAYDPNSGGNITNAEVNLGDSSGTAGDGLLRPSTGIVGVAESGIVDAVVNTSDKDLQGNSTSDGVDTLLIRPDKDPSTDGAIYRIHELVAWEEERSYDERRSLLNERPQPWHELDAPAISTLNDPEPWASLGISEPPHLNIDIPRYGVPARMRSAWQRSTEATYWDENGVLQTAPAGEPRVQHDPVTGDVKGVLAEPQRTNQHPAPRDLASYNAQSGFTSSNTTSVDGTTQPIHYTDSDGGGDAQSRWTTSVPDDGRGYTMSFFVKKGVGSGFTARFRVFGGSGSYVGQLTTFDPQDGTRSDGTASGESGVVEVEDFDGWWRVKITINNNSSGNTKLVAVFYNLSEVIIDAVQVEDHHAVATDANGYADATHATMPILSGGATRSEDRLVMPLWWPQGIVSGGYYEAFQEAGGIYVIGGGLWTDAFFNISSQIDAGEGLTAYDQGLADATDGSDYSSGAGADGSVQHSVNTNDPTNGRQEVERLYMLPDRTPLGLHGATHILRRLYLWPQELTEGSGGQLESLFNHDFSV